MTDFSPIPVRRTFEQVCAQVRAHVSSGRLRPGDKLPTEKALAEQFGVSRLAIREALRSLENSGLIVLQRGYRGGAMISDGNAGVMTGMVQDMLDLGTIPLADLTEARIHILETVVRLACQRATEADLEAIEASVRHNQHMLESDDREARMDAMTDFYARLTEASKNKMLMVVVGSLTDAVRTVLRKVGLYPSRPLAETRGRFMTQLRARNVEKAVAEMREHQEKLHKYLILKAAENKKFAASEDASLDDSSSTAAVAVTDRRL